MEDPSFQQQVQQIMMNAQLQQQQEQEQALPTELPPDYSPGPYDICCGRGKRNWNHTGNKAFRELIQSQVDGYVEAGNKTAKTAIVVSIVDQIRHMGAHFLKQDTGGRWYDIGDKNAREKVGHSLRDQVTALRQKSNKERAAAAAATSVLTAANLNQHQQLYHHQQQQQLEQQQQQQNHHQPHQPHQPSRSNNAGVTDSWLHAVTNAASRPSEVWSDFGGEEELRRSTLETTPILEKFGRRPSWLAMSFVDAAAAANINNHNNHPDHHHHHTTASTLQQAATQATVDFHQQEEMMMMPDAARCESGPHIVIPSNAAAPGSVLSAPLREAAVPEEAALPQDPQGQVAYHHQQPQPVNNHMNAAAHDPPPQEANTSGMMVPPQQPQPVPSDTLSGAVAAGGAAAVVAAADDDDAPEQGEDDDRRASAISLMSLMDLPEDMFRMSFANAFRSSMRRSSMSWVTNTKDMRATRTSLVGLDSAGSPGGLPW